MRSRLLPTSSAALAALVFALLPAIAGAAPPGDSSSGNVTFSGVRIDWSARSTNTGLNARGNGRVTFTNNDPNVTYAGDVTCLRIVGATATTPAMVSVGVLVTQAPPGSFVQSLLFFGSDAGKFSSVPDTATWSTSSAPPPPDGGCPAPFAGIPVTQGQVVITNELP